jgi:hypothetical protein
LLGGTGTQVADVNFRVMRESTHLVGLWL